MPKNIVVCFDGTNNQFGSVVTNVIRLYQVIEKDSAAQIAYYDLGLGTMPEPLLRTRAGKYVSKVAGLAFGSGITGKLSNSYRFLMDNYEVGDRIFLFGFSRGAYTARALGGVLHHLGLLRKGQQNLLPYVMRRVHAIRELKKNDDKDKKRYFALSNAFRSTFGRSHGKIHRPKIHFVGVWDTVSTLGYVWDPKTYPYTAKNPSISTFRHALSIDERRSFFRPNLWNHSETRDNQDILEVWFPGCHSDVGGGNSSETNDSIWRASFFWMLREARKAGLVIDQQNLGKRMRRSKAKLIKKRKIPTPSWQHPIHESLCGLWKLAEFVPKLREVPMRSAKGGRSLWGLALFWKKGETASVPLPGLFASRSIASGSYLHRSVLRRMAKANLKYRPVNLPESLESDVSEIRALSEKYKI